MKFSKLFFVSLLLAAFVITGAIEAQTPKWDVSTKLDQGKIFLVSVVKLDSVNGSVSYTDWGDFSSTDGQTTIYAGYKLTSTATTGADSLRVTIECSPNKVDIMPFDTLPLVSNKSVYTETSFSPVTSHAPFRRLKIETIGTNLKADKLYYYEYALKQD